MAEKTMVITGATGGIGKQPRDVCLPRTPHRGAFAERDGSGRASDALGIDARRLKP